MKLLTIILLLTLNLSYAIGLKALVIPNSAEMIALSSTGIAGNIDSEINKLTACKSHTKLSF